MLQDIEAQKWHGLRLDPSCIRQDEEKRYNERFFTTGDESGVGPQTGHTEAGNKCSERNYEWH
jgi:hypothetical protein